MYIMVLVHSIRQIRGGALDTLTPASNIRQPQADPSRTLMVL